MKRLLYSTLYLAAAVAACGCYEDKSTSGEVTGEVTIAFPGVDAENRIEGTNGSVLTVDPVVTQADVAEPDLSYEWFVSASSSSIDSNTIRLGTERRLEWQIGVTPSTDPYTLALRVTDNRTGIKYIGMCGLMVYSSLGDGLVVADTQDGVTGDLSLIRAAAFCTDYAADPVCIRNVYSLNNGAPFEGPINTICYAPFGQYQYAVYQLLVSSRGHLATLATDTYAVSRTEQEIFLAAPGTLDVTSFGCVGSSGIYAASGEDIYFATYMGSEAQFGDPANYAAPGSAKIRSNGHAVFNSFTYSFVADDGTLYATLGFTAKYVPQAVETSAYARDLFAGYSEIGSFAGKTAEDSEDNRELFHVMRAPDGSTGIYGCQSSWDGSETKMITTRAIAAANCPEIESAIAFDGCVNRDVFYYATSSKIYAAIISGTTASANVVYTAPAGCAITCMSIFREAWYNYESSYNTGTVHDMHDNMVIAGIYDSAAGEGTLCAMPIASASGALTEADADHTFTGFGRITAVGAQGKQ